MNSLRVGGLGLLVALAAASCARPTRLAPPEPPPVSLMQRVIPAPVSIEPADGEFVLGPETAIVVTPNDADALAIGRFLSALIGTAAGSEAPRVVAGSETIPEGSIHINLRAVAETGDEGYELEVAPGGITIAAGHPAGLFYGIQTLRQLLPPHLEHEATRPDPARSIGVPAGAIRDSPRFEWRGAMLDVSRHFFSVEDVKRYVDLLALYKMNRLHLHLADDQGWRIEIMSWPRLATHGGSTEVGGGPGGHYTQAEYADLVAYAQRRFVTIVPEIDMPGHTNAALASYPELNCDSVAPPLYTGTRVGFSTLCVDKDVTYRFIDDVVREIAALTPGRYIHIGGDEVERLSEEEYGAFVERAQQIVQAHRKQVIGWDEIAHARLTPGTVVQQWRPDASPQPAIAQGARIIVSSADRTYLDMKYQADSALGLRWAGLIDVRTAYTWDPATLYDGVPESSILGVEAPIWSETLARLSEVEFMAFPRLPAIAEIGWSAPDGRNYDEFSRRLGAQAPRWSALGVNYYRAPEIPWER
ncbi:MAG: beta-N-acetylhexosaminidase [Vicinamibacterales bacterium]|jgi:hexosaminidase|nr:beta-N-acetylhexosaminidase [Acidobacteriota bacterium]MDP7295339.1 beta-N-acetylhexosaminidase [Vicinamibacterales bacterium]MDP7472408.1 beta-N-acetylhexosaminidase [Vicinamibacterales bacterium]MDP7670396.1 beta-N-acetylhexosaminidase [Vicinamibacterales bacterium]HJO38053.1 beta-N-acetylhexosaminidase [Vicinamibacterales bacterium]|tara:strand:- start:5933 stop:7522 length:1590 start_codon:yes stop_codon:yes gene_type:complete